MQARRHLIACRYALTTIDPTAAIEKAARLTSSWQVSRANHGGGVNGVWRNPLDALLLVEQLALHGALYGSPVIHPGHKRLAPLKSTSLLHRLISKARQAMIGRFTDELFEEIIYGAQEQKRRNYSPLLDSTLDEFSGA